MPKFMYFNLDQQIKELVIKKKKNYTKKLQKSTHCITRCSYTFLEQKKFFFYWEPVIISPYRQVSWRMQFAYTDFSSKELTCQPLHKANFWKEDNL